jgi:hypothetical protein
MSKNTFKFKYPKHDYDNGKTNAYDILVWLIDNVNDNSVITKLKETKKFIIISHKFLNPTDITFFALRWL